MEPIFDVAIIGGGINGCGIAADAATRGLSVVLFDKGDLGGATSASSTKLIHGGLRYLEYYDFALVKKALQERQRLMKLAPHLVRPIGFVLPHEPSMRSFWFLRAGLFLYDHLSHRNTLPSSRTIKKQRNQLYFSPLKENIHRGFLFYDCATDDARLTLENALQAKQHQAKIYPYSEVKKASVHAGLWQLKVRTPRSNAEEIQARVLVNATGPWVETVNECLGIRNDFVLSLIKGSHIVVQKLYDGEHAYMLQHTDNRIIFVIPYYGQTLIGTTEIPLTYPLEDISILEEEIDYLLTIVEHYFKKTIEKNQILDAFSGVRPLLAKEGEDPKALSRDYVLQLTHMPAPALTVYGGKLTTYRQLAREAINAFQGVFKNLKPSQTADCPLPGAKWKKGSYSDYCVYVNQEYPWLAQRVKERLLRQYGTRMEQVLADCNSMLQLGEDFGHGLYQREVDFLCEHEWAHDAEAILWHRSKLGLLFDAEEKKRLEAYLLQR